MNPNWSDLITDTMRAEVFLSAMKSLWAEVAGFIPNLLGALFILLVGYLVAKGFQKLSVAVLKKLRMDSASERVGLTETLKRADIRSGASEIVGKIVFWIILLTFLIPASESLGLERVSETINSLIDYLPNVIGASLIVVVGMVVAYFVRNLVRGGAESINFEYAEMVAKLAYGVMMVIVATLAIGQLKIETDLLKRVVEIILIASGAALAIGLGIGSRELARHVLSGVYARDAFQPGTTLKVNSVEGQLEVVGAVSTRIKSSDGSVIHIPNGQLIDTVVHSR